MDIHCESELGDVPTSTIMNNMKVIFYGTIGMQYIFDLLKLFKKLELIKEEYFYQILMIL